ncbi:hypothetical protein [Caldovatus aquaticus]|uniref:Uncharacterized protein n=1 Tax=Caldovatus aquaticus TaxID=2865671 RepID=A0ABS7F5F2_9PROT|nr:hypothetical protein [Caldovatus aquaticus]MBW8270538.1 hypothetical protein [Caldovatus aquaticus]
MPTNLIAVLQSEERQLVAELRATITFQRLDAIRRLIALYGGTSSAPSDPPPGAAAHPPPAANAAEGASPEEFEERGTRAGVRESNKAVSVVRAALAAATG